MNTWTCKTVLGALCLLGLSACDESFGSGTGFNLVSSAPASGGLFGAAPPTREVSLADGAVTLVPPDGYCVDTKTARQTFAIIARCDLLGAKALGHAGPAVVFTASVTPLPEAAVVQETTITSAKDTVLDRRERDGVFVARIKGTPPQNAMNADYWRGAARVGTHLLGLGLYSAAGRPAIGPFGQDLLFDTIKATQAASKQSVAKTQ